MEVTMPATKEHATFVKNLEKLDKIVNAPKTRAYAISGAKVAAIPVADICKTYGQIKPILNAILPVLEKIPVIGKVVGAIRILITIADAFCKGC
jgi:hypothetical protein